jgi:hypothetical protein
MVVLSAGWCRRLGVICGGGLVVRAGSLGERVIGGDDHGVGLLYATCQSATTCVVAGDYTDSTGSQQGMLLTGPA